MLKQIISNLGFLQALMLPGILILFFWGMWRAFIKNDKGAGLIVAVGVVVIVDVYMAAVIPVSGILGGSFGSIRYSDMLILLILFKDSPLRRSQINIENIDRRKALKWVLIILMLFLYAAFRAHVVPKGLAQFRVLMLKPFLFFYVASTGFESEEDYKRFIFYLIILGLIYSLVSVELKFFDRVFLKGSNYDDPHFWRSLNRSGRVASFFGNPNNLGNICVMFLPLHIVGFFVLPKVKKAFAFIGFLLLLFALLLTDSRGSIGALIFGLLWLFVLPIGKLVFSKKIWLTLLCFLIFLMFMPGAITKITNRMKDTTIENQVSVYSDDPIHDGESFASRVNIWRDGIIIGMTSPMFGIGLGEYDFRRLASILREKQLVTITLDHAHSTYINIFVQTGIITLIVFIFMNMSIIIASHKVVKKYPNHELSSILTGLIASISGFLFCLLTQNTLFKENVATTYWLLLGVTCGLIGKINHDEHSNDI